MHWALGEVVKDAPSHGNRVWERHVPAMGLPAGARRVAVDPSRGTVLKNVRRIVHKGVNAKVVANVPLAAT